MTEDIKTAEAVETAESTESTEERSPHSPEQLDQMVRIISPYSIIAIMVMGMIIVAGFIWGTLGHISVRVNGIGVLVPQTTGVLSAVASSQGRLVNYHVAIGEKVAKDQVLASMDIFELKLNLDRALFDLAHEEKAKTKIEQEYALEKERLEKTLNEKRDALLKEIDVAKTFKQYTLKRIQDLEGLLAKGFTTKEQVEQVRQELWKNEISLKNNLVQITQVSNEYQKGIDFWRDKLREQDKNITQKQKNVDEAKQQLETLQVVKSPADGVVVQLDASLGAIVEKGQSVAVIMGESAQFEALVFAPATQMGTLKPGQKANVYPSSVKREEYGSLVGVVESVEKFPSSRKSMLARLQNEELVASLLKSQEISVALRIRLVNDYNHPTGYKWTSKGPEYDIGVNEIANATIVTKQIKPIALVIPVFKKLFGV